MTGRRELVPAEQAGRHRGRTARLGHQARHGGQAPHRGEDFPVGDGDDAGHIPLHVRKGKSADALHDSAKLCIGTGVAGFSIEDFTGDAQAPVYTLAEAVDRVRAARSAINASGQRVLLTARSEVVRLGHGGGLAEALTRLTAYAEAGADVLFAPGLKTADAVAEVVRVAGPLPVNVLVGAPGFTKKQLEDLGVRRISTGAALARAAWGGFIRAAADIAEHGRFDALKDLAPAADLDALFRARKD